MRMSRLLNQLFIPVIAGKKAAFTPLERTEMIFWFKSDSITTLNDSDVVAALADSGPAGRNLAQATAEKKPLFKINILNGLPGILFDNVNDCLQSSALDLSAYDKITIYTVFSGAAGQVGMVAEFGTGAPSTGGFSVFKDADNKVQFIHFDGSKYAGYLTTDLITTVPKLATFTLDKSLATAEATGYINGLIGGTRNYNQNTTGNFSDNLVLNIGSRNNGASNRLNGYFFEAVAFGVIDDAAQQTQMNNYLAAKWGLYNPTITALTASDFSDNGYSTVADRSDAGTFIKTSPGARVVYTTDAEIAMLDLYSDLYSTYTTQSDIGVRVDGADLKVIEPTADGSKTVSVELGTGAAKTVEFIAGGQSGATPAARIGSYIGGLSFNKTAVLTDKVTTPRMIVYGDSIVCGFNAANPSLSGVWQLVRNAYAGSLLIEARGYRSLYEDCSDAAARTAFTSYLSALSPSVFWMAIGVNDYGLSKWTAANFGAAYADMLDKLHTALPDLVIYAQTPLDRSVETANALGSTLGDYRTVIATAQSTRSAYCTLVDGTAILEVANLPDGTHPDTAGHALYATYVETVLGL